jgi:50S ribosome-binding GTPase
MPSLSAAEASPQQLGLATHLRTMHSLLGSLRERHAAAARAVDLLERDLLPRSAGGEASLVVGIVGPNNAGKSALFNALVGRPLSPSVPSGGATRRLVGAAHPALLARLRADPTLARFHLTVCDPTALSAAALRSSTDPAELLIVDEPRLAPGMMLIDTPDFDSILHDNRLSSESLLAVADLVIVVVTRHSYQNREVVSFLRRWLADGRPWLLVYNEAIDDGVTRTHAAKLATDLGTPPLALYAAPHDLEVQGQTQPLEPREVPPQGRSGTAIAAPHPRLRDLLTDASAIADIKSHAFAAALARLRHDLADLADALVASAVQARSVLQVAEAHALDTGTAVASTAMPGGPFIEAFRAVLDRRSNPLSRSWRTTLRALRLRLENLPRLLRGSAGAQADPVATLGRLERDTLDAAWPRFWEELVRDLGPEARHAARRDADRTTCDRLDVELTHEASGTARRRAEVALLTQPADFDAFRQACEVLVEKAIEDRGFDVDIQAAADMATVLPLALAAAIIVKTGGIGTDLAIAGGGALGTFLFEKYAHLLGGGIMAEARRRWTELRGRQLATLIVDAVLPEAAPALRASAEGDTGVAATLRRLSATLCKTTPSP